MRARSGFTLAELMTVVAVLALLMAVLMPTLWKLKYTAYDAQCKLNLRELSSALRSPRWERHSDPNYSWTYAVIAAGAGGHLVCPMDSNPQRWGFPFFLHAVPSSYAMNGLALGSPGELLLWECGDNMLSGSGTPLVFMGYPPEPRHFGRANCAMADGAILGLTPDEYVDLARVPARGSGADNSLQCRL